MSLLLLPRRKQLLRPAPNWRRPRRSLFPRRCRRCGRIVNVDQLWIQDGKLIHDGTKFCIAEECPCEPEPDPDCELCELGTFPTEIGVTLSGMAQNSCIIASLCTNLNTGFTLTDTGLGCQWQYDIDDGTCMGSLVVELQNTTPVRVQAGYVDLSVRSAFWRQDIANALLDCANISPITLTSDDLVAGYPFLIACDPEPVTWTIDFNP